MDCAAGKSESESHFRVNGRLSGLVQRCKRTCLRSDSMIVSFCFICARRYSRLLTGGNEYSSLSEDEAGVRGGGGSDILG
jgi:hypothetical protein